AAQPGLRQRAHRREAFHPVGQGPESQRGLRRARAPVPHRDGRAASSERHREPVWLSEQARHRGPVTAILQPEARRDVRRRAAVHRGVQPAACRVRHPERVLRSAQVSSPVQVLPAALRSEQPHQDGPQAQPVKETVLQKVPVLVLASDVPLVPLRAAVVPVASERDARPAEPQPEAVSVCAAARPEAASARVHAVGVPQPEAATAASEQQLAAGAAWVRASQAAAAEAAVSDAPVRQRAAVERADAEEPRRAAARRGVRELQAALRPAEEEVVWPDAQRAAAPLALPSEAASVFRQGPILAGLARRRAAARFAHAMRWLPIASRSEPLSQAARNEGWSCGSNSPEGSLTKCWDEQLRVRPDCGGRSGRDSIYFCTEINSLW
ncbi:hypothetical protein RAD16_40125, partial [Bradyrhizobium sp. 18BD]